MQGHRGSAGLFRRIGNLSDAELRIEHHCRHALAFNEANFDAVIQFEVADLGRRCRRIARDLRQARAAIDAGFRDRIVTESGDMNLVVAVTQPFGDDLAQVFPRRVVDQGKLVLVSVRRSQVVLTFCQQRGLAAQVIETLDNSRCDEGLG